MNRLKSSGKILIVEDDEDYRFLIKLVASKINVDFDVVELIDGEEFVNYMKTCNDITTIKFITLDFHMPKINGIDALKKVVESHGPLENPVLLLTTDPVAEDLEVAKYLKYHFMKKPHNVNELTEAFKRFIKPNS